MTLQRRTGLNPMSPKRRAELAAAGRSAFSTFTNTGAGLSRAAADRDRKPKRKPAYTGPSDRVKALVDGRSGGRCEWPGCERAQQDRHHRLNRKAGGRHGEAAERINQASWLLGVCRRHHDRVTNPVGEVRVEAERMGWILREHQDAATTPVLTRRGWLLLGNGGDFTICNPNQPTNQTLEATA
ncbi:hypothetical protein ABZY58_12075 [Micromonospora tulbaghiae]|uniref:hypothetical protein n=1 Tax=Micromonospora tulbaghiae TaxID=479978 RepID=UPI0033A40898